MKSVHFVKEMDMLNHEIEYINQENGLSFWHCTDKDCECSTLIQFEDCLGG